MKVQEPTPVPAAASRAQRERSPVGRLRRRWIAAGLAAIMLLTVGWSYGSALTAPGTDSAAARSVEWMRFHGLSRLVTAAEHIWYSRHPPPRGGVPSVS